VVREGVGLHSDEGIATSLSASDAKLSRPSARTSKSSVRTWAVGLA